MLAVAASFFVFAAVRAPVPGPNEPHYLAKARHFWNPDWCAGDFFLESSSPHRVFYAVVGPLTVWFPFPAAAWIGRAVAHVLLALGWTMLVASIGRGRRVEGRTSRGARVEGRSKGRGSRVEGREPDQDVGLADDPRSSILDPRFSSRWLPLWAAWLYLAVAAVGNLAGEWIVGGVEAKVFGFALVFLALALAIDRRWYAASVAVGLAIAWHPLVGLWALVAAVVPALRMLLRRGDDAEPASVVVKRVLFGGLLLGLCALPGLLPALELIGDVDPRTAFAADFIQVQYRLAHHLDPMAFSPIAAAAYVLLFAGWLVARRRWPRSRGESEFAGFVVGTVVVALVGLAIGFRLQPWQELPYEAIAWRVKLLKFYWFRMADVFVPVAAAITAAGLLVRWGRRRLVWALPGTAFAATLLFPGADGPVTALDPIEVVRWHDTCEWIRLNTPEDAFFKTPNSGAAFKWYAQRAEFVALKDAPQDPEGIVEWNRRLRFLAEWAERHYDDERYTEAEIRELARAIDVDYFVAWYLGPIEMEPVYDNGSFRVYDVRER